MDSNTDSEETKIVTHRLISYCKAKNNKINLGLRQQAFCLRGGYCGRNRQQVSSACRRSMTESSSPAGCPQRVSPAHTLPLRPLLKAGITLF
ncbi:hypothetical protein SKAU_G00056390 [Synaphobranchus kaupii]|uniref:Uncharacterized protein n=1 Tax=Synaphobranchus kaupii TaxID=118154 RepID=A0A9Q1J847_SYNKA|nr:hypothetical protein SKAU_G00056390 [Synaphobranchus kaupii]